MPRCPSLTRAPMQYTRSIRNLPGAQTLRCRAAKWIPCRTGCTPWLVMIGNLGARKCMEGQGLAVGAFWLVVGLLLADKRVPVSSRRSSLQSLSAFLWGDGGVGGFASIDPLPDFKSDKAFLTPWDFLPSQQAITHNFTTFSTPCLLNGSGEQGQGNLSSETVLSLHCPAPPPCVPKSIRHGVAMIYASAFCP